MSAQPSGLVGQPNASASGFHMAITTGLVTRDGAELALVSMMSLPCFACHCALTSANQALPAGLQMSGWIAPSTICCIDCPDPIGMAFTVIGPSHAVILRLLKSATTSLIQASFSLP